MRINIKPLSVNKAWQGRRFKTAKYKSYEKSILLMLPSGVKVNPPISLDLIFGFSSKNADIDNPVKLFMDCLVKKYGFDDRDIYEFSVKKEIVPKGKEFIDFEIYEL